MVPCTLHLDLFVMMNKHGTQFVGYPPVRSGRAVLMLSCPWDPTCPKHCCRHPRKWVLYLPAGCLLNPVLVANPGLAVRPYMLMKSHIFSGLGTHFWRNHNFCHLYSNFSWLTLLIVPICLVNPPVFVGHFPICSPFVSQP